MGGFSFPNAANTFTTTMNIPVPTANTVVTMPTTGTVVSSTEPMSGMVIQVANFTTGAMATGTALIPADDTIPQNTEGTQFMSLAFTPKRANSKLKVEVIIQCTTNAVTHDTVALFRDAGADAIGASTAVVASSEFNLTIPLIIYVNAVSTASTTFNVRVGSGAAGTTTLNGRASARLFGGSLASSITITEIAQ